MLPITTQQLFIFTYNLTWSNDETRALVELWADEQVQNSLNSMVHNKDVYIQLAASMRDRGSNLLDMLGNKKNNDVVVSGRDVARIMIGGGEGQRLL